MEISSNHHHHHQLMATGGSCSSNTAAAAAVAPQMALPPAMTTQPAAAAPASAERKPRPQPEQALKCPRCESTNTKFCYYNNYSMSQPRYFCKGCRRYWTQGGSLRNVPVGGGCRKNKRSSSSSSSSSSLSSPSTSKLNVAVQEPVRPTPASFPALLPTLLPQTTAFDLTADHLSLAFASSNPATTAAATGGTFLDILRGGLLDGTNSNQHAYYGGSHEMVMPFGALMHQGGGSGDASTAAEPGGEEAGGLKVMTGLQWQPPLDAGGGGTGDIAQGMNVANNMLDGSRDCYWINGGVGTAVSSWHGLVNSSLM